MIPVVDGVGAGSFFPAGSPLGMAADALVGGIVAYAPVPRRLRPDAPPGVPFFRHS